MRRVYTIFFTLFLSTWINAQSEWEAASRILTASNGQSGDHFGGSVDVGGSYAVVGAPDVSMGGAIYVFKKDSSGKWVETQKINGIDAVISPSSQFDSTDDVTIDGFGKAVALAESPVAGEVPDMIVVGAPTTSVSHDGENYTTGAACIYELNTTSHTWEQQDKCILGVLFNVDPSYESAFGKSVDISSWMDKEGARATMVIGDPDYDQKYINIGMSALFGYSTSGWELSGAALGSGGATGSSDVFFGKSVAIDRNITIIGSPGDNIEGPDSSEENIDIIEDVGAVYFLSMDGSVINRYTPPHDETVGGHHFGSSVDIYGGYAIVSEEHREGGTSNAAVYILKQQEDGNWTGHNYIENNSRGFGYDVAINDTHAAVTALNGPAVGAFYAYEKDAAGNWNTQAPFYWLDSVKGNAFGFAVGLYGDTVLVGAPLSEEVKEFDYVMKNAFNPSLMMYLLQ
jgi:hypothetical protein